MSRANASSSLFGNSDLERVIYEIGQRLGQAMVEGLKSTLAHAGPVAHAAAPAAAAAPRRGPGRPPRSAAEAKCIVPGCVRRSVAKKLCPTHYRKAGRLNMKGALTESQLEVLRKDGRATRWETVKAKASKPAKIAKKAGKPGKKGNK